MIEIYFPKKTSLFSCTFTILEHTLYAKVKSPLSKHRKNYILREINYFVKMSFSTLVFLVG